MSLSLAAILHESAERRPDHPAVVLAGTSISYRDLWHGARQYAAVLREAGIGPGDRVALLIPNTPHFPLAYYGVLALGATAVPVHALLRAEEIAYVLEDSGSKALVCAGPLLGEGAKGAEIAGVDLFTVMADAGTAARRIDAEAAAATPVERYVMRGAEDVAVVLYTSGTTGRPKGAQLTHLNLLMNVEALALSAFDINGEDRVLGCLPLFHSFGQTVAMNLSFRVGATVVMLPRFDGIEALRLLVEERCTLFMGVPTMYVALLAAARRSELRPGLRFGVSGGASLPLTVLEDFEAAFGIPVYEGYGLTETSPVATFNQQDWPPKPGTIGRPIWGVDVEIARPEVEKTIELLPTGELGELVVRGHNVMKGYLNRPEDTAEVMVDGWFRTGDLGTKDADGYLTIVDRKKDMVLRGGYNVYPREVEEVLLRNPAIGQVAVIGVPDDRLGEEVCAVVIPAEGAESDADAIVAWSREALAAYKYPRRIEFVDEFPLGPSGKVLKRELVARYGS
ncbi:MAG TPA: long-chain fatty acid--CoA ligase [Mycobacteriales bacterium]|jgi:long-chain acyl-CoA synthetase|nr:long-chain fatty acid--CoA ligase [Mycobacteriales bacterium]